MDKGRTSENKGSIEIKMNEHEDLYRNWLTTIVRSLGPGAASELMIEVIDEVQTMRIEEFRRKNQFEQSQLPGYSSKTLR